MSSAQGPAPHPAQRDPAPLDHAATRLVIAYAFAPDADTSAIVTAKRIVDRGEPVDVISNSLAALRHRDDTLTALVAPLLRRHEQLSTKALFGSWKSILAFCERGLETLAQWESADGGFGYTTLYSRAHFIHSHFLAALVKLRQPQVHWTAEFSDIASLKSDGSPRDLPAGPPPGLLGEELGAALAERGVELAEDASSFVWAEAVSYALADEVLFTNPVQADQAMAREPDPVLARRLADRSASAPHPTLAVEHYRRGTPRVSAEPGVVRIGYFGNFYLSQRPRVVFQALAAIPELDRLALRLEVFTNSPDAVSPFAADLGVDLTGQVRISPALPYLDFLATMRRMDVLLAIGAESQQKGTPTPVLLSKSSDYAGSGRPVWLIADPDTPIAAGPSPEPAYRTPSGHVTAAMQTLIRISRTLRAAPD